MSKSRPVIVKLRDGEMAFSIDHWNVDTSTQRLQLFTDAEEPIAEFYPGDWRGIWWADA